MKKFFYLFSSFVIILLLSACSVDSDAAKLYRKSEKMKAVIVIPKTVNPNEEVDLKVEVTKEDKKVEKLESMNIEIWKKGNEENKKVIEGKRTAKGTYEVVNTFSEDGIYYVKAEVRTKDLHIMPTKQMIVGELSEEEAKSLEPEKEKEDNHHSHH
ncbi:FixH family protein [Priestia endophytica]|uniref:FixH family protein n=1 Tax=Priestia endophytica TaxID=135735 RepID=UPI00203B9CD6|nr:FixH family protein [Priestia endophytica]MCM3536950.1 FixH family protein [Priestia endophytica]